VTPLLPPESFFTLALVLFWSLIYVHFHLQIAFYTTDLNVRIYIPSERFHSHSIQCLLHHLFAHFFSALRSYFLYDPLIIPLALPLLRSSYNTYAIQVLTCSLFRPLTCTVSPRLPSYILDHWPRWPLLSMVSSAPIFSCQPVIYRWQANSSSPWEPYSGLHTTRFLARLYLSSLTPWRWTFRRPILFLSCPTALTWSNMSISTADGVIIQQITTRLMFLHSLLSFLMPYHYYVIHWSPRRVIPSAPILKASSFKPSSLSFLSHLQQQLFVVFVGPINQYSLTAMLDPYHYHIRIHHPFPSFQLHQYGLWLATTSALPLT
jgi:hypothetical protein